jgi:hypothetical protein
MAKATGKKNGGGAGRNGRPKGLKFVPKLGSGKSGSSKAKATGKTQGGRRKPAGKK